MYWHASLDGTEVKLYREHWMNDPEPEMGGELLVCGRCFALVVSDYSWYHDDLHDQLEALQDQGNV